MPWLSRVSYSPTYLIAEQMQLAMAPHGTEQQEVLFDKSVFILFLYPQIVSNNPRFQHVLIC